MTPERARAGSRVPSGPPVISQGAQPVSVSLPRRIVARQVGEAGVYDFAVTHDRQLVVDAGRALLRHVDPISSPT